MTVMLRLLVLFTLANFIANIIYAQNNEDILMKVGSANVSVGEFKYIYEKNNGVNADYSKASLNEYLDLYTKFKLKVEKAKQLRLDTIEVLITELDGYRKQLASSYLIDKEVTEFLLKELYNRMKFDVEFSHIFIPVPENAPNSVKDEAKNKLKDIKAKINGGMTFENAAISFSEDRITAPSGGAMGYFTAKLPSGFYNLESALYNVSVGQISDIVESKIGYHLIKVTNKRQARGTIEVAHILFDPTFGPVAESVYSELNNDGNFNDLVLKHSIDKSAASNEGVLPPFGINTYDIKFEDVAFSLNKPGDISKPVLTKSGWHIIKLIQRLEPDSYDIFVKKMKQQINRDERFNAAKVKMINDIKKASGFKEDLNELKRFTSGLNEDFYSYKWAPEQNDSDNKFLCSFGGDNKYLVADFADFCKKNTRTRLKYDKTKPLQETVEEIYNDFVNEKAMEFEEKSLPIKYPDFKSLMREYEEGILLFEVTKMNVWDKANQDTIGLKEFYHSNKEKYIWPEKASISNIKINGTDRKTAEKIYAFVKKSGMGKLEKKFNAKTKIVEIATVECEAGSKDCEKISWGKGAVSSLIEGENGYTFSYVSEIIPVKVKTLADARGYVVADYQDFLEKDWIEKLSKEFKVILNQDVINKLKGNH